MSKITIGLEDSQDGGMEAPSMAASYQGERDLNKLAQDDHYSMAPLLPQRPRK